MFDIETMDGRWRFEIIDGDVFAGDPVGDSIGDENRVFGVFVPTGRGSWKLWAWMNADRLADILVGNDDAPSPLARWERSKEPPHGEA